MKFICHLLMNTSKKSEFLFKMTSSTTKKLHSRRRLAALTFLSNISLDGTHRDTTLGTLNFNLHFIKSQNESRSTSAERQPRSTESWATKSLDSDRRLSHINEESWRKTSLPEKGDNSRSANRGENDQVSSKNKDRVHKFMSEAKARLCNLSLKRKHLLHQKSIESYGLPSGKSTESLTLSGCRSRKASLCPSECSFPVAVEIRYLKNLKEKRIQNDRIVLISAGKAPFVLFSILPYRRQHSRGSVKDSKIDGSRRHTSSMRQLSIINDGPDPLDMLALLGIDKPHDGQDISFSHLLDSSSVIKKYRYFAQDVENPFKFPYQIHPSRSSSNDYVTNFFSHNHSFSLTPPKSIEKCFERDENLPYGNFCHVAYNPNLLDDPELIAGKHSTLLVFPSYITSIIDYVKPSDLKKDLNDKFKERFPQVQLTLSKLRSIKREMHKIVQHECNIDLSVVAQAFVYFEKLILKILINKQNRKLCAGACLLLSAKLNDVRGADLRSFLERIETVFRINRKDLMSLEFGVLVALEFSLLLSPTEILPHYQRLLYES